MNNKGKTVLVTGGAGFIGSHLCSKLLDLGHEVVCMDNYFTGCKDNVRHLLSSDRFELIRHDVTEPIRMEVDAIFHLACPASPVHYQRDPVQTVRTNILGTLNMLDLAKHRGVPMIHASTSEVYGDPQVHPQPEGYWGNVNPIGPRACYDEGKRCAETLASDYRRAFATDTRIVRIFNTYGPRIATEDGRVISNFIVQALRGEAITVYGDGGQTRCFQYVDDLIRGLLAVWAAPNFPGPVNLGNPVEYKIKEVAQRVLAETGSKSKIVHKPLPVDDPRQRQPDITLAKEKLDWSPRVSLEEGLRKTIAYFKHKS
ncbi:MAG: SDR family oxidoreductase [Deltaproteobacteria bacterium]|nr:SDR family oxidoreductase [Deltaproteobacteria bacterium]MBI4224566.1 SDR family oxidoreductase [Deltaproteobacteria bacterium]